VLGIMIVAMAPVSAGESGSCNFSKAISLRAQADRARTHGQLISAAQSYIAASRAVNDCRTGSGLMLSARSLAQGGTALAQGGDYFNARSILLSAQERLQALFSVDAPTAASARSYFDLVQSVISAIDRIARFSV
jgi:hypothetical protein